MRAFVFFLFCLSLFQSPQLKAQELGSDFLSVKGTRYHYLSSGDRSKPLVLFLHGFPELSWAWANQLKHFSKSYHAVAIDLKGYNLSDRPAAVEAYSLDNMAADIPEIIRSLGHSKAYLVGHDWGAALAWTVTFQFPDVVQKLIIINGAHPIQFLREYYDTSCQYQASDYIRKIRSGEWTAEDYARGDFEYFRSLLFGSPFFGPQMRERYLTNWRTDLESAMNYYRAMKMPPAILFRSPVPVHMNPMFKSFHVPKVPVLVLWGEKDEFLCSGVNSGLGKFVSNLKVRQYSSYGHWFVHEAPDVVNRELEAFIQQ